MGVAKNVAAELELVRQIYKLVPRKKRLKVIRVLAGTLEGIGVAKKAFDQDVKIIREKFHSVSPDVIFNTFIEACQNYAYYLRVVRAHLKKGAVGK